MKSGFLKKRTGALGLFLSAMLAFGGCNFYINSATEGTGENTSTEESSQSTEPVSTEESSSQTTEPVSVYTSSENETSGTALSWDSHISIEKERFADFCEGSQIVLTVQEDSSAVYHNVKLYDSQWNALSSGGISGGTNAKGTITPTSGTITYTVTAEEATRLVQNGLILHGYGVLLTDITLVIKSGAGNTGSSAVDAWTGSTDFNDSDWKINIQIPAEKFSSFAQGSRIQVEWHASSTATSYKKLKFCSQGTGWPELTGGTFSGGSTDSEAGVKPESSPLSYTVTAANAAALKENGLAIQGYGVVVTKVTLVTSGSDGTGGSSSSSGSGSSGTGTTPAVTPDPEPASVTGTPYANHGKLHVSGAYLYDEHGAKYQLYGMSTHGISFENYAYGGYLNAAAMETLRDDWNTNCIRIVMYPRDYNGYLTGGDKAKLKQIVCNGIEAATSAGMYVLVDWHVHNYNPCETQNEAITFLREISAKYANYGNVLYEICNEPTNSPWNSAIKPYAEAVIPAIRANAPDAVIIVGTNTWSQDVEGPLANPLSFKNVMYTFHFYANTHTASYRSRVESAIKQGLPIFITEFGTCDASGNGGFNSAESQAWFDLCATYSISHLNWSLCNKGETASAISSGCSKTSGWSVGDLTESGKLVRNHFRTLSR